MREGRPVDSLGALYLALVLLGSLLFLSSSSAEDEFSRYEESIAMTCFSDEGKVIKWSFRDSVLYMDVLPFQVNDESVKKKSGENVFIVKAEAMEFFIDFDKKRQVTSLYGMEFENRCF
jgi:hypothetical protein